MVDNDTQMGYHFSMREHIASMNIINVNKIAESIEKANGVLDRAKGIRQSRCHYDLDPYFVSA
jgi:hypothetical protein